MKMLWMLAVALPLLGCTGDDSAEAFGSLVVPQCNGEKTRSYTCEAGEDPCKAWNLRPDFTGMSVTGNTAFIRIQRGSFNPPEVDGIFLTINDIRDLELGADSSVGRDQVIRAGLLLGSTCGTSRAAIDLNGTLVMEAFGTDSGDRVAGRMTDLVATDARTGESLGQITVTFDFEHSLGPPFQQFSRF